MQQTRYNKKLQKNKKKYIYINKLPTVLKNLNNLESEFHTNFSAFFEPFSRHLGGSMIYRWNQGDN